jgi:hypothetical protein
MSETTSTQRGGATVSERVTRPSTTRPKTTCGPLYQDALRHYAGDDPERIRLFAAGFVSGQAEKVYLGACRAAMFRPSPDRRAMLLEILEDVARRYGLHYTVEADEIWLWRDPGTANAIDQVFRRGDRDPAGYHRLRGMLCGVPPDEIDEQFHRRPGHGQRCD